MTRVRFKHIMRERCELSTDGQGTLLSVSENFGVMPRSMAFANEEFESRSESLEGYRIVRVGDLVMNYMLAWKGAYGISSHEGLVSPAYAVFSIDQKRVDLQYLHHRLRTPSMRSEFKGHSKGIIDSRLRLYPDAFLSLSIDLPSIEEQRRLAASVEVQIARIDTLIDSQKKAIALLKERKDAVAEVLFAQKGVAA